MYANMYTQHVRLQVPTWPHWRIMKFNTNFRYGCEREAGKK